MHMYAVVVVVVVVVVLFVCACVCMCVQLVDSGMDLPSLKRLCRCRTPDFSPLPSLISSRMALASMEKSVSRKVEAGG